MMKNKIAAMLAIILAISVTACSSEVGGGTVSIATKDPLEFTGPWIDSDLFDTVSADKEIRLQDDFAAASNKEWKLQLGNQ